MKNKNALAAATSAVFGVASAFMPALTFLRATLGESLTGLSRTSDYTGFYYMLGQKDSYDNVIQEPVAGLIIAWTIGCLGILCVLVALLMSIAAKKSALKIGLAAIGGLCLIAYGVMVFFTKNLIGLNNSTFLTGSYTYSLGIGAILAGVFGILAGLLALLSALFKNK